MDRSRMRNWTLAAFVFTWIPTALAQPIGATADPRFKVEIPIHRAAKEPEISRLLANSNVNAKDKKSLSETLSKLGKSCGTCMITVKNDPPKFTSTGDKSYTFGATSISASAILAAEDGTVAKAEDCPIERPFYVEAKKRCYSLTELFRVPLASSAK